MNFKQAVIGASALALSVVLLGCGGQGRGYDIPDSICEYIDIDPERWEPLFPPGDEMLYRGGFRDDWVGEVGSGHCSVEVDRNAAFNIRVIFAEGDVGIPGLSSYRQQDLSEEEAVRRSSGGVETWMWPQHAYSYFLCRESDPYYGYEAAAVTITVEAGGEDGDFTETLQEIMDPLVEETLEALSPDACVPDL